MMIRRSLASFVCVLVLASTSSLAAQRASTQGRGATQPTAVAATSPSQPSPAPKNQSVNIRVDVTITEQGGSGTAVKRVATIVTGDGLSGSIRALVPNNNVTQLSMDAKPSLLPDGKIRLLLTIVYVPSGADGANSPAQFRLNLSENLQLVLESGKPVQAAESFDPAGGDRQFAAEVKATILK